MPSSEFADWLAYSLVEPFGERRADQRAWLGVAAQANFTAGGTADLARVLPEYERPQDPEEVAAAIHSFFNVKMAADAARAAAGIEEES